MPKPPILSFDSSGYFSDKIGPKGLDRQQLAEMLKRLDEIREQTLRSWKTKGIGFLSVPERRAELKKAVELAGEVSRKFKTLIVVGVGGSDLGAKALLHALKPHDKGMDVRFIGANTDPEEIAGLLASVDLKKCAISVVSKSGNTIEPMSTFVLLRDRLVRKVGKSRHAAHVIATTDPEGGTLRAIATREGYRTLPVPPDVGGRYSALTPVGLFPAACAGVAVNRLLDGAARMRDEFLDTPADINHVLTYAGAHHLAYAKQNRNIAVLMPYVSRLDTLGRWYVQLVAESLGKRLTRSGHVCELGITPIAALGATDQHSQIQLYNEGPHDKMITFIETEKPRADFAVPNPYPDIEGVAYMAGHRFSEILHAERQATALALAADGRPNGTIFISSVSEEAVGGLMMFFMLATSVMAELMDVNAYDQPGVESGKRAINAILGRKGFIL